MCQECILSLLFNIAYKWVIIAKRRFKAAGNGMGNLWVAIILAQCGD